MKYIIYFIDAFYLVIFFTLFYGKITTKTISIQHLHLYANDNTTFYSASNNTTSFIELHNISPITKTIFIHIEDQHFYSHNGFDFKRTLKACYNNLTSKRLEGASTITQQLARTLVLDNSKTYTRKSKELHYAIQLEKSYSKSEILEEYFNALYFGHGLYGIKEASYFYFNTDPQNLNLSQAAILLCIINNPTLYSPLNNYPLCLKKRNQILNKLRIDGIINKNDYDIAQNDTPLITKTMMTLSSSKLFYRDMVLNELKALGISKNYNNLEVYTGYDETLNHYFDSQTINSPNEIALVSMQNDGLISMIVGSKNYYNSAFNRAYYSKRQVGSTMKPFLYYQALTCGLNPLSSFISEKTNFYYNDTLYSPSNYNDLYENAPISMLYALATSDNIYAMKTLNYIGFNNFKKILKKLDINQSIVPSSALGSFDETLFNLTKAYNVLCNGGYKSSPYFIKEIKSNGKIIYSSSKIKQRLLNSGDVFIINELLTNTLDYNLNHITSVTCTSISHVISSKMAVKSGSTNNDSWVIGFNPDLTLGIWSGCDENSLNEPLSNNINIKLLWANLMELNMKNKEEKWYLTPENIYYKYVDPSGFNTGYKKWVPFKNPLPFNSF